MDANKGIQTQNTTANCPIVSHYCLRTPCICSYNNTEVSTGTAISSKCAVLVLTGIHISLMTPHFAHTSPNDILQQLFWHRVF